MSSRNKFLSQRHRWKAGSARNDQTYSF